MEREHQKEKQKLLKDKDAGASAPPLVCALRLRAEYLQFAEFKRMEREHQKEKQKLLKDKDAGASFVHSSHSYSHAVFQCSEKPTYEG